MKTIRDYLNQFYAGANIQADHPGMLDTPVSSATWLVGEGGALFCVYSGIGLISFQPEKTTLGKIWLILDDTAYNAWNVRRQESYAKGEYSSVPMAPSKILRLVQTA
jgi:hypothetical protein